MENAGLCLERSRILGASVIRYSTGEFLILIYPNWDKRDDYTSDCLRRTKLTGIGSGSRLFSNFLGIVSTLLEKRNFSSEWSEE